MSRHLHVSAALTRYHRKNTLNLGTFTLLSLFFWANSVNALPETTSTNDAQINTVKSTESSESSRLTSDNPSEAQTVNVPTTTITQIPTVEIKTTAVATKVANPSPASIRAAKETTFTFGQRSDLSTPQLVKIAKIFDWNIDFVLNIQSDAYFSMVYTGTMENPDIVAVEMVNRGKSYRAVRYIDKVGKGNYYKPNGESLDKYFIPPIEVQTSEIQSDVDVPVEFTRISSYYGMRFHPRLHRMRFHKGIDYAAPVGTPVTAAADGVVTFADSKKGYGKTIVLQHDERHETLYAHMSDFALNLQEGQKVKQGEIIGFVGQTGLTTGPHLHFEFRIDGEHQDPIEARMTRKEVQLVATNYKTDFLAQTKDVLAQLNAASQMAQAEFNPEGSTTRVGQASGEIGAQ